MSKLIASLERTLGASLFNRTAQGVALTSKGEIYLESCQPILDQLAAAEEALRSEAANVRGTLVVGAPQMIAQHCLLPALPGFHARYPDLQIDIRHVGRSADMTTGSADVYVLWGWMEPPPDLVQRRIGQSRFLICASRSYWAEHGVPQRPKDLERHACLLFRTPQGTVHDLWQFEREGVVESVAAKGWLISDHRDVVLDGALAGEGVARLTDLTVQSHVHSGRLVPVLPDWAMRDAPPVELFYRPKQRRASRVRVFIDFVSELFRELEADRGEKADASPIAERPRWWARQGRASVAIGKRD